MYLPLHIHIHTTPYPTPNLHPQTHALLYIKKQPEKNIWVGKISTKLVKITVFLENLSSLYYVWALILFYTVLPFLCTNSLQQYISLSTVFFNKMVQLLGRFMQ